MSSGCRSDAELDGRSPDRRDGILHLGAVSIPVQVIIETHGGWRVSTATAGAVPRGLPCILEMQDGCKSEVLIVYREDRDQGAELCLRRTGQSTSCRSTKRSRIPTTWALSALLLGAALGFHMPLVKWCRAFLLE